MAILLEEEKKPVNWFGIIAGIVVALIIVIGGYVLFFKKPDLIEVVVPQELQDITTLSKVPPLDPQAVVNSSNFKSLKDYTSPLPNPVKGRSNPFAP